MMAFKVRFEAELDPKLKEEIDYWGLSLEELVREGMEHSIWGAIRRKTDNLCRACKKPIRGSIPPGERNTQRYPAGFCECK